MRQVYSEDSILFSPLGRAAGGAGEEATAETALQATHEARVAQRPTRPAVQTDRVERGLILLGHQKPAPVGDLARRAAQ